MSNTLEQISSEALKLPSTERARLADRLVRSLKGSALTEIDKLWVWEAKRRRDEVREGKVQTIEGDEGLRRVRDALGR